MRRSLRWALGATVGLTLLALWTQQRAPALIAAIEPRMQEQARSLEAVSALNRPGQTAPVPLPAVLPSTDLEPARRDIFASRPTSQPVAAAQLRVPTPPAAQVPVPIAVPTAPPMGLRYMGSMVTPDGQRLVYLARGDVSLLVAVGDRLDEGYVVESIDAEGITLVYPPLGTKVTVPMPPAPTP